MGKKVLLPQDIAEPGKRYLRERGYEIIQGSGIIEEQIMKDVAGCDAIIARLGEFTGKVMEAGPDLKIIARHGAGYDNIDLEAAGRKGIWVTNDPVSNINAVAEHVIAMMLGCAKNLAVMDGAVRAGNFKKRNENLTAEVSGKTLGIIGFGRIGRLVAKKAGAGLGMNILVYDKYAAPVPGIHMAETMEELLSQADFVSIHTPLTGETEGLFGREQFERMKETAFLINGARGELVREAELIEALNQHTIAGAALDVFEKEPPSSDNPLFTMENVLLSPHNAALTREAMDKMALTAAMAVDAALTGKRPDHVVTEGN